jgi:hypothetical protein
LTTRTDKRYIICLVASMNSFDLASSAWCDSVMTLGIQEFFDGDNITLRENVVCMKEEEPLLDGMKRLDSCCKENTFLFERE